MSLKTTQVKTAFLLAGRATCLPTRWKNVTDCRTPCLSHDINKVVPMHAHTLAGKASGLGTQSGLVHTCWPPSLVSQEEARRDGLF